MPHGRVSSRGTLFKSPPPRSVVRITEPGSDPVTLAEQKEWSRIKGTAQDTILTAMITGATRFAEDWMQRSLISQGWQITFDSFPFGFFSIPDVPQIIELPYGKIISLDEIEVFFDDDTSDLTIASRFQLDKNSEPGRIILKPSQEWPSGLRDIDAVKIQYTAGFGATATSVPQAIKDGIHYIVADRFENRENMRDKPVNMISLGAEQLLMPWKIWTL